MESMSFATPKQLETWMRKNHASAPELWLKVHKKDSGLRSVTCAEALDVMLCWGWIDGLRRGFDEQSFLQRYSPRRAKSIWSQINRDHVARLTGRSHDAARSEAGRRGESRWPMGRRLCAHSRRFSRHHARGPARRHQGQCEGEKKFETLGRMNLFALGFRTNNMKTAAGREKKIATLVAMLARGETIVPEKKKPKAPPKRR